MPSNRILALALDLRVRGSLSLLCLRLLVNLLPFWSRLTNIFIYHFKVTTLEADVLGADLGPHPHGSLHVQLDALEVLLKCVAKKAELVPGGGQSQKENWLRRRNGLVRCRLVLLVRVEFLR